MPGRPPRGWCAVAKVGPCYSHFSVGRPPVSFRLRLSLLICRSSFFWLHQQRIQFRLGLLREPVRRQASQRPQHDQGDVVDRRPAQLAQVLDVVGEGWREGVQDVRERGRRGRGSRTDYPVNGTFGPPKRGYMARTS